MSRLEAYWPLDESSGDVIDYSGNGLNGTNNGATQGEPGLLNTTAYDFDGVIDDIEFGADIFNLPIGSVSIWFNTDSIPGGESRIVSLEGVADLTLDSGNLNAIIDDGSVNTITIDSSPDTGQWNHVVYTWDGTTLRGYKNGVETASTAAGNPRFSAVSRNNRLAAQYGGPLEYDGRIEEVRVYSRPLTSLEVKSLYDAATTAYFKTDWQTFSDGNVDPTSTFFNIDVSLNNQSVKAFIVSDIDGDDEIDEASDPIDITSNTENVQPTSLPTLNDKFALLFEINTTNVEEGPVVNSASFSTTQEDGGGEEPTTPTFTATDPVGTIQVGEKQVPLIGAVQPVTVLDAGIIQRNIFTGEELEVTTTAGNYIPFREASFADTGVRAENIIEQTVQAGVGPVGEVNALIPIIVPITIADPVGETDVATRQASSFIQAPLATQSTDGTFIFENISEQGNATAALDDGATIVRQTITGDEEGATTDAGVYFGGVHEEAPVSIAFQDLQEPTNETHSSVAVDGYQIGVTSGDYIARFDGAFLDSELNVYRVVSVSGSTSPVGSIQGDFQHTNETYNTGSPGQIDADVTTLNRVVGNLYRAPEVIANVYELNATQEPFTASIQDVDIIEAFIVIDRFTAASPTVTLVNADYFQNTYTAPIQNATLVDGNYITPVYEEGLAEFTPVDGQFLPETIFTVGQLNAAIVDGDLTQATIQTFREVNATLTDGQLDRITVFIASTPVGDVFALGEQTFGAGRGVILRTNVQGIILTDDDYDRETVN